MESKELIADVVIGTDIRECLVLASHPDERLEADETNPSLTRRTIAIPFDGHQFGRALSLPFTIHRGWTSANGTAYCTPIRGKDVHIYAGGRWRHEPFAADDEDILYVWGLSGTTPAEDVLYLSTDGALYMRREGAWSRHEPPDTAQTLYAIHGRSPQELYICSDIGLLLWAGDQFKELEDGPKASVKTVLVSGDEIYAGDAYLMHWTATTGWQRWQPPVRDPMALLEVGGTIAVGTFEHGVMERRESRFVRITPDFMCLELQTIGQGAVATGDDQSYIRIADRWQRLPLPSCAVGELP